MIVTGASRGIGRAVAEQAARRGARVGLLARTRSDLEDLAGRLGVPTAVAAADVGNREEISEAMDSIEAHLGPADVLVANAGVGAYGPFAEVDLDQVERLIRVNLLGTVYALRAVLPGMLQRGRGHLAVVSSVAGRFGAPFEAAYGATKSAQIALAEALSVEVAGQGVDVSIIDPGVVDTDFFRARGHPYERSFPRPITPARVAATVIRAVESGGGEFFVPRSFRAALAARHLVPGLYAWGTRQSFRKELRR